MASAKAKLRPRNEAPRPTFAVERGLDCQLGGDDIGNIIFQLRHQRLSAFGLRGRHAALVAELHWGEVYDA